MDISLKADTAFALTSTTRARTFRRHSRDTRIICPLDWVSQTYEYKNPTTLIEFDKVRRCSVHPTQKPVDLLEYLIRTYTNENELVLDFTMGSGSTGVACMNTNRKFIGIELDKNYFNIAKQRIEEACK